ncbi:hypothetical protein HG531_011635 [Fusarium graminearum]|nr:hypothetical protein HG531_011635 [Fusarium graminearum]
MYFIGFDDVFKGDPLAILASSSTTARTLGRITHQEPDLAVADFDALTQDIHLLLIVLALPVLCEGLVPAASIDSENASHVVTVSRDRKFAIRIPPLVEKVADRSANLVLAVLTMVSRTCDGINGLRFSAVFHQNLFEILDCLLRMETMKVDI